MRKLNIPFYYAFYHFNMIKKIASAVVAKKSSNNLSDSELYNIEINKAVPPPNDNLLDYYRKWSGSDIQQSIPFHLVSLWSFPLVFDLLAKTGLPVVKVVNQGLSIQINDSLPLTEKFILNAKIKSIENTDTKKKLVVPVSTSTASQKDIIILDLEMSFPQKIINRNPKSDRSPSDVSQLATSSTTSFSKLSFSKNDGLNYSLLTGDFNPIHWLLFYAKKSPFKTTIMQGFGSFSKISSILEKQYNLTTISIKFLKPITLPSPELSLIVNDRPSDILKAEYYVTSDADGISSNHVVGEFTYT